MKAKVFVFFILLIPCFVQSQMLDDFSDSDFLSNPVWSGDADRFIINSSKQLQLNHLGEDVSALVTQISLVDSMEWTFWVKLSFSPSDNNNVKIYLLADNSDLSAPLNGYYLKLGENGSNDAIELFKQSGTTHASLCRGTAALVANSLAVRIRVIRSKIGDWKLWADPLGGKNYRLEASASDLTHTAGNNFGVQCKYTSSNAKNFFFDDFYAGNVLIDNVLPTVQAVTVIQPNQLDILFSEAVNKISAENILNYSVNHSIGNPLVASCDLQNTSLVHLQFAENWGSDIPYEIKISGIKDLEINEMKESKYLFSYRQVKQFDVLIHEVMADPDPAVGLPNYEYIELYNRSDFPIDLNGWKLLIGSISKALPQIILPPQGFLILAASDAQSELGMYGLFVGFSGFSLTNGGTALTLTDNFGKIIHTIIYTDLWYHGSFKKEGGWSLGMVDVLNPCGESSNWSASTNFKGGTPGSANSQAAPNKDLANPFIQSVGIHSSNEIVVLFSEKMDSATIGNQENYRFEPESCIPNGIYTFAPDYRKVLIRFTQALDSEKIYYLSIKGEMKDCVGNLVSTTTTKRFGVLTVVAENDLIINEVLFAPKVGCQDFVEIYNKSDKIIDFKELNFANYNTTSMQPENLTAISTESILCFPDEYVAFTIDTAALNQFYPSNYWRNMWQIAKLPSMAAESGTIALTTKSGELIDCFVYTSKMHYPLLLDVSGVSLERINPQLPSTDKNNWHSAAESVGYVTPGCKNSQFASTPTLENDPVISLTPTIFSPDNDGYNDVLAISYNFDEGGYSLSICIYDASGRLVRNLCKNELCGSSSGTIYWDGLDNQNHKALIGRYIIVAECFNLKGNVKKHKKTTVLGGKI